jgi:hypothetical protein
VHHDIDSASISKEAGMITEMSVADFVQRRVISQAVERHISAEVRYPPIFKPFHFREAFFIWSPLQVDYQNAANKRFGDAKSVTNHFILKQ